MIEGYRSEPHPAELRAEKKEMSLEDKIKAAEIHHDQLLEKFELNVDEGGAFAEKFRDMQGLDHGPAHEEGDPAVHTKLMEYELNQYLEAEDRGLSAEDIATVQLAGVLHDIGKADTQKYDVVNKTQKEKVGASDDEVRQAQGLKDSLLKEVADMPPEEIDALLQAEEQGANTEDKAVNKKNKKLLKTLKKLRSVNSAEVVGLLTKKVQSGEVDLAEYNALAANFLGHEKLDQVEGSIRAVLQESGRDFSDEQEEDILFLVSNHMLLHTPDDLRLDKFRGMFLQEDGSIDDRKIEMLKALTVGDSSASVNSNREQVDTAATLDAKIASLKKEHADDLIKQAEKERLENLKTEALGGSMADYVTGIVGDKKTDPKRFGKARGMVNKTMKSLLDKNSDISTEELRAAVEQLEL